MPEIVEITFLGPQNTHFVLISPIVALEANFGKIGTQRVNGPWYHKYNRKECGFYYKISKNIVAY